MFSWMNANSFSNRVDDGVPADEAVLDALVDDELDDDRRREFLRRMDVEPAGWRRVALRFLQRQVERRAVRDLIGVAAPQPSPAPKAEMKFLRWYPALRVAAVVMIVVGLVGIFAVPRHGRDVSTPVAASRSGSGVVKTTAHSMASNGPRRQIQFFPGSASRFLGASNEGVLAPQYGENIHRAASRELLVPRGGNRVTAYPVEPLNAKGVPLY